MNDDDSGGDGDGGNGDGQRLKFIIFLFFPQSYHISKSQFYGECACYYETVCLLLVTHVQTVFNSNENISLIFERLNSQHRRHINWEK